MFIRKAKPFLLPLLSITIVILVPLGVISLIANSDNSTEIQDSAQDRQEKEEEYFKQWSTTLTTDSEEPSTFSLQSGGKSTPNGSTFTFSFSVPAKLRLELNGAEISYQSGSGQPQPIKVTLGW